MGIQELSHLSQSIRSEQKHKRRVHWPQHFKKAVIFELSQGASVKAICKAAGINSSTVQRWLSSVGEKGKKRKFKKVHTSPFRDGGALLLISTQKDLEVKGVSFSELRQLLKKGLL